VWDLVVAALVLTALSSVTFVAGWRVVHRWDGRRTFALSAIVLGALLVFISQFHGTWRIARVVPFSGAIILGNWIPIAGAFFAGVMLGLQDSPPWRRGCLAALILLVSLYSVVCCFLGELPTDPPPTASARWSRQSQPSSCGPCCAALLLRHYGIEATEKEMLRLCLTSHRGSPALGLYRGLKLKTAGTGWDVEVVSSSFEKLIRTPGPLLLRITIPPMVKLEGKRKFMERRSYEHAVLLLEVDKKGHAVILDPAVNRDMLCHRQIEELREMWCGEALRLTPRNDT